MSFLPISEQNITSVLQGSSVIDLASLEISTLEQAYKFIHTYGYDLNNSEDLEEIWGIHRKAVSFLRQNLINDDESIPDELADPALLGDIGYLIVKASQKTNAEEQCWACAILKVMHSYAHVDNDLFSQFSDQIQEQVLKKIKSHITEDPAIGCQLGFGNESISLHKFEVKPFKRTSSSVLKFLSRKQTVALTLLDRLGVRFVSKNILDAFRVLDYLIKEQVISFPNVMPGQSNNTLYPLNLLLEIVKERRNATRDELNKILIEKLNDNQNQVRDFNIKNNEFSAEDYKFMKFICRQLIEIEGDRPMHFFFPFEIQIVDYDTYINNLSGPQAHEAYKNRQRQAARLRVLGRK